MKIEIAAHCVNYQHRLCWMLSSILQQKGSLPSVIVNVSFKANNGNPTTEEVCSFFRDKGLNIKETLMEDDLADNRSHARNRQVEETNADWILFADCDMVYHPEFFEDLKTKLENEFKDEKRCIGADRHSLQIDFCEKYFDKDDSIYPRVVENVVDIVSKWPIWYVRGKKTAAGYFQLGNVKSIKESGGKYSGVHRDNLRRYRADRGFRCIMGGRTPIDLKPQYHLNHTREDSGKQR